MMATARYYFSCNTVHDWEIIQWLDSFASRERSIAIKAAIQQYQEETEPELLSDDRLSEIEKSIKEVLNEVVDMRRKGLVMQSERKQASNNKKEYDLTQVEDNLKNLGK